MWRGAIRITLHASRFTRYHMWSLSFTQLSTTIVILNTFYKPIKLLLLGMNLVFKHQDWLIIALKLNYE